MVLWLDHETISLKMRHTQNQRQSETRHKSKTVRSSVFHSSIRTSSSDNVLLMGKHSPLALANTDEFKVHRSLPFFPHHFQKRLRQFLMFQMCSVLQLLVHRHINTTLLAAGGRGPADVQLLCQPTRTFPLPPQTHLAVKKEQIVLQ